MTREPLYNLAGIEEIFENLALDAIVARSGRNVAYLTGMRFPGTLGRLQDFAYAPRAVLAVLPARGEPALTASAIAGGLARRLSWVEDLRIYTEYQESPFALAAAVLRERGLDRGRIGIERRELAFVHWEELSAALPRAELIDCTAALESARNIKTPAEIAILRRAAEIQDRAHIEVFSSARPGDTERALHARMIAAMLEMGAESAHGMLQASTNPVTYGGEGDTPIDRGVAVRTDYVCYVDGYAANLSRMAVMGKATAGQQDRYAALLEIHRDVIETTLRPGVEAQEVYAYARERLEAAGSSVIAGLVGHSVGVWWHQEEPMLVPGETRKLRSGMVICLEPILDGFWHLQDEILVTDDKPEVISTLFDTTRLFEMG